MLLTAPLPVERAEHALVKRFDPVLTSPFHMEWLVPLDATTEDDYTRAIAEKAEAILRSARFMSALHADDPTDLEVRLWVEAAQANGCVSITWEPGVQRFGFHLLDESLRERLGCIVFDALPCVGASESLTQAQEVMDAALEAMANAERKEPDAVAAYVRASRKGSTSVRIHDAPGTDADE
ncbi:MAG: hypothetical protein WDA16_13350 [Candidatus Thermoplasmatota archaeon]